MRRYKSYWIRKGILAAGIVVLAVCLGACSPAKQDGMKKQKETTERAGIADRTGTAEIQGTVKNQEAESTAGAAEPDPDVPETPEDPPSPTVLPLDLEEYFEGLNGCAVFYRPQEETFWVYGEELAHTRRSPCSTFKIISSLAALETGLLIPEDSVRTWSGEIFWNEDWNRDLDFEEAFRISCVWYFREVIDQLGKERMQEFLDALSYGNCDISDWEGRLNTNNNNRALTGFWIESSLKISPLEQTQVMEKIFGKNSPYSRAGREALEHVMLTELLQEETPAIYGKTGLGKDHGVVVDAWFTGFARLQEENTYFCVYLGETPGEEVSSQRARELAIRFFLEQEKLELLRKR